MAAVCAACLVPIRKNEKFRLVDTEVFHEVCVMSGAAARSIGTKRKLVLIELKRQLDDARQELLVERQRGGNHLQQVSILEQRIARAEEQRRAADERAEAYQGIRDHMRRERDALKVALDRAIAERDAARREAALHQTIQAVQPQPISTPAAPAPVEPAKDERDSTEQRFGLLELD